MINQRKSLTFSTFYILASEPQQNARHVPSPQSRASWKIVGKHLQYSKHVCMLISCVDKLIFMTKQLISLYRSIQRFHSSASCRSAVKPLSTGAAEAHHAGREWLKTFSARTTIPRNICDISFSRSSGPGGQNVNK